MVKLPHPRLQKIQARLRRFKRSFRLCTFGRREEELHVAAFPVRYIGDRLNDTISAVYTVDLNTVSHCGY